MGYETFIITKVQVRKEFQKLRNKIKDGSYSNQLQPTGTNVDLILEGINKYLLELAKKQIKIVFEQSEKEVADLRQRTREGVETARLNGKQIGLVKGTKLTTKKNLEAMLVN